MLESFNINLEQKITAKSDIETDSILILPLKKTVFVKIEEIKSFDSLKWTGEFSNAPELLEKKIQDSLKQLFKHLSIFYDIFAFLKPEEMEKINVQTVCSFPNIDPPPNLMCPECRLIMMFKDDFNLEISTNKKTEELPSTESLDLYIKMLSIYIGVGSLIKLKTQREGYDKERMDLSYVKKTMFSKNEKIIRLGPEQMTFQYQKFIKNQLESLCLVGPYGSGKSICLQILFDQVITSTMHSKDKSLIVIVIWEEKAEDLKQYYKNVCKALNSNVELKILFKYELQEYDNVISSVSSTTEAINSLCRTIENNFSAASLLNFLVCFKS